MKFLFAVVVLIFSVSVFGAPKCELKGTFNKNKHYECQFEEQGRNVQFLELFGDMKETAYAHGYFLADDIRNGALKGVIEKKDRLLAKLNPSELKQYLMISKCVFRNYKSSVSDDFINMSYAMAKGLHKRGVTEFSKRDVLEANMMVELSIYFDGLEYLMDTNPSLAKKKLLMSCPMTLAFSGIKGLLKKVTGVFKELKFGCTGIAASGDYTTNKELILSRNFDTGLLGSFEKYPVIIVHHPKNGYSYVGMGSAGLHFPGGISGFNEKGITVSLHELQTTKYRTSYFKEDQEEIDDIFRQNRDVVTADIAPYMLNKLLMKAGTMKEAIKFIKERGHFGAWTVFIGDSKTGEIASVEFSGNKVRVARKVKNSGMAQSNHFIHKDIKKYAFEYSYNKSLETRSRFDHVTKRLNQDRGEIDSQWMINMLSGHVDHFVGKRSFGRTTTKVYTSQSHIMLPKSSEFWFSLGEVYPTTSSTFVGFNIDFSKKNRPFFTFLNKTKAQTKELEEDLNWSKSLGHYVQAYLYTHTNEVDKSINELDQAIKLAEMDNIIEVPYYQIRGRFLIKKAASLRDKNPSLSKKLLFIAKSDYEQIIMTYAGSEKIHDYQLSLAYLWSGRVSDLLNLLGDKSVDGVLDHEKAYKLQSALPNIYPSHYAFSKMISSTKKIYTWKDVSSDDILMGTAE